MARPDALVCPSVFSRNREFKPPLGHEQMACGFPRKARCPPGLAAVTALRAGRDDPRVHPQDVCDSRRAAARRSLNTPPRRRPGFPAGPSSPPCPTPAPSPSPSPSPSGTPSPRARQAPAELRGPPHRQWPAHRAATEHVTACLSGARSGDEDDPVPGLPWAERAELLGNRAGWLLPGRSAGGAPQDLTGRIAARPPSAPEPLRHRAGDQTLPSTGRPHRMFHLDAG
jgi:hypothetical protein